MFSRDEKFKTVQPTAEYCKRCKNALASIKIDDVVINRYAYIECDAYKTKPHDVLWEDAECPEFKEE